MVDKDFKFPRWIAISAQMLSIVVAISQKKWATVALQLIAFFIAEAALWYARKRLAEEEEETLAILRSCRDELIAQLQKTNVKSELCLGCSYLHGRDGIVCAVHPEGHDSDDCIDFEPKKWKDEI